MQHNSAFITKDVQIFLLLFSQIQIVSSRDVKFSGQSRYHDVPRRLLAATYKDSRVTVCDILSMYNVVHSTLAWHNDVSTQQGVMLQT